MNALTKAGVELGEDGSFPVPQGRLDEPEPCRKHYFLLFGSLTEEAPTMRARASSTLKKEVRRDDGGDHHHPLKLPLGAD